MAKKSAKSLVPSERIERAILLIRGDKVLIDRDLAELYGVRPKALIQAVKRNSDRFPPDFMFQLTLEEAEILTQAERSRSQIVSLLDSLPPKSVGT